MREEACRPGCGSSLSVLGGVSATSSSFSLLSTAWTVPFPLVGPEPQDTRWPSLIWHPTRPSLASKFNTHVHGGPSICPSRFVTPSLRRAPDPVLLCQGPIVSPRLTSLLFSSSITLIQMWAHVHPHHQPSHLDGRCRG